MKMLNKLIEKFLLYLFFKPECKTVDIRVIVGNLNLHLPPKKHINLINNYNNSSN